MLCASALFLCHFSIMALSFQDRLPRTVELVMVKNWFRLLGKRVKYRRHSMLALQCPVSLQLPCAVLPCG